MARCLSFSAARELTRVATQETEGEWLGTAEGKNLRDIQEAVSGRKRGAQPTDPADPALRKKVLRLEVSAEMFALWRQVQQAIEKEKGERVDDSTVVACSGARISASGPSGRATLPRIRSRSRCANGASVVGRMEAA